VVQVHEIGRADGRTFIAMELVRGQPLDQWQQARPGWRECVHVYLQAGQGLAAAHAEGLVHRDFKPSNCILGDDDRVRVLDFGLARLHEPASEASDGEPHGEHRPADGLTQTGTFMGTLAYMPLEQLSGKVADAASDQFSFCVSLYEALYGERPFAGRSASELATSLSEGRLRPAAPGPRVPTTVRRVLRRGLAHSPAERWPSMDALLAELSRRVRPRRLVAPVLVTGGLLAVGAGLWQQARVAGQVCHGAETQLADAWGPTQRAAVEAAIARTSVPYAATSSAEVTARLDAYASEWARMHQDTCEATHLRREQTAEAMDLRMGCLQDRKLALREAADVLARVDATSVERAVNVAASLPALAGCARVQALQAAAPPPDDPERAAGVRTARARLARARALESAGRYDEALDALEPLRAEAERLGHAPLRAEVAYWRGAVLQARGQPGPAAEELEQAYAWALEHGHDEVATDAAGLLVFVAGVQGDRLELGRQWGTTALALARRGNHVSEEATALLHLGMVLRGRGDDEQALAHIRRALEIKERELGPQHPHVAVALGALATVLEQRGALDEALETLRRGQAIDEQILGPEHPQLATSYGSIGRVLVKQGLLDEGLAQLQRALAIYEAVGDGPSAAAMLDTLAQLRFEQGRIDDAAALLERALARAQPALGSEHPEVGTMLGNLANVRQAQGRLDEALELQRRALAIHETALGPEHVVVAYAASNLGLLLHKKGAHDEALVLQRRALAMLERIHGPSHPEVAAAALELGMALHEHGERAAALELVERARAIAAALGSEQELADEARKWLDQHREPAPSMQAP
jgi:tetratricopeptide (TPR) repeat protein